MSTRIRLVAAVVAALLLIGAGVALAAPPSGMAGGWARGGMMDDPDSGMNPRAHMRDGSRMMDLDRDQLRRSHEEMARDPEQRARQHQQMHADPEMQRRMQTRHHTDGQGPHCPGGQPREQ
jgi:hypothetical protein